VFALSLVVGVIGGIYSIVGGGSIIAQFLVVVMGLPVYTVAGATILGTFVTSVAGVVFFEVLATTSLGAEAPIAADWLLGAVLGVGDWPGPMPGRGCRNTYPTSGYVSCSERWLPCWRCAMSSSSELPRIHLLRLFEKQDSLQYGLPQAKHPRLRTPLTIFQTVSLRTSVNNGLRHPEPGEVSQRATYPALECEPGRLCPLPQ
jgi:hypothetical protein